VSRGSAKPVMAMSRAARENLWRSVVEGDRALADAAEEELEAPAARGESSSDQAPPIEGDPATTRRNGGAKPRRVPLRAYVVRTPAPRLRGGGGSLRSWDDVRVYSAPVELDEDGSRTVGDALASVCVDDVAKTLGDGAVVVAQGVRSEPRDEPRGGAREAQGRGPFLARRRSGSGGVGSRWGARASRLDARGGPSGRRLLAG
jgi:hypothetical protein